MQKATADFLSGISIDEGLDGLFSAARQTVHFAEIEPDRALAGSLLMMRWVLLGFAYNLEADPAPVNWQLRAAQLEALVDLVRHRSPAAFANFASFPA